jgi:hypothetical protein
MPKQTLTFVSHTHWDREWYRPLPQFIAAIREADPELETRHGEMRDGSKAPLLPGVLSTRMRIKQRNAACPRSRPCVPNRARHWRSPCCARSAGCLGRTCRCGAGTPARESRPRVRSASASTPQRFSLHARRACFGFAGGRPSGSRNRAHAWARDRDLDGPVPGIETAGGGRCGPYSC